VTADPVDLPDVNVWLALSVSHHPHHTRALAYWSAQAQAEVSLCRVTMLGLLRLLTQPRVMDTATLTAAAAMQVLQRWRQLPEVSHRTEPAALEARFEQLLTDDLPPRLLTDAYLAAYALAGGMRLVSFDRDFRRFPGLSLLLLDPKDTPT
jgi:toxin-antitoxin system PIN domain toxin